MVSLIVLVAALVLLRGAGYLGVGHLSSWGVASRYALAVMFVFTGVSHFTDMKHDFAAMIPSPLPNDLWVIYLSGALEIAGAAGLLIPRTRKVAGICLMLMLMALFPANVYAALTRLSPRRLPTGRRWRPLDAAIERTRAIRAMTISLAGPVGPSRPPSPSIATSWSGSWGSSAISDGLSRTSGQGGTCLETWSQVRGSRRWAAKAR